MRTSDSRVSTSQWLRFQRCTITPVYVAWGMEPFLVRARQDLCKLSYIAKPWLSFLHSYLQITEKDYREAPTDHNYPELIQDPLKQASKCPDICFHRASRLEVPSVLSTIHMFLYPKQKQIRQDSGARFRLQVLPDHIFR